MLMRAFALVCVVFVFSCCATSSSDRASQYPEADRDAALASIVKVPLAGAYRCAGHLEISGMDQMGNELVLLPQYPERGFARVSDNAFGYLLGVRKDEVGAFVEGKTKKAVSPRKIKITAEGDPQQLLGLKGYEGFEAIAFGEEDVFFAVEMEDGTGLVLRGDLVKSSDGSLESIRLNLSGVVRLEAQMSEAPDGGRRWMRKSNKSYEAAQIFQGELLVFYEVNTGLLDEHAGNHSPVARRVGVEGGDLVDKKGYGISENVFYRFTDVTGVDQDGVFWVANYAYKSGLDPEDPLVREYRVVGPQVGQEEFVERLVAMQHVDGVVISADRPPVYLVPEEGRRKNTGVNWEGIARLEVGGKPGVVMVPDLFSGSKVEEGSCEDFGREFGPDAKEEGWELFLGYVQLP